MIHERVDVTVPDLKLVPVEKVTEIMGDPEQLMTVVFVKVVGDAPGVTLLLFVPSDAGRLASLLHKQEKNQRQFLDEMDYSALRELCNILSGASLSALANFLDMKLLQSIPYTATDMLGAVVNTIVADLGEVTEEVLILEVSFSAKESGLAGDVYFLFDPSSTEKILAATRKKIQSQP